MLERLSRILRIGAQGQRFSLFFALALVLLIGATSFRAWKYIRQSSQEMEMTRRILDASDTLFSSLMDAESRQRGYWLTGNTQDLAAARSAIGQIPLRVAQLEQVSAARPDQIARVQSLKLLVEKRIHDLGHALEGRAVTPSAPLIATAYSAPSLDDIRALHSAIQSAAKQNLARYSSQARERVNELGIIATFGSGFLGLLLLQAVIAIRAETASRLRLISGLRASEARMKQSRDWLAATLRSIGDAVIATDSDGDVLFLNDAAEALTGWTQAESAGNPHERIFQLSDEETGNAMENPVRRVIREQCIVGPSNHAMLETKDGRLIPVNHTAGPIRDQAGNVTGVVLVFRDITAQKQTHRELRKSESRFRTLLDANPIGVMCGFLDGGIGYANDAYLAIIGYTREEFEAGAINRRSLTPPEWLPFDDHAVAEAMQKGVCTPYEKEYIRKDGSRVPVYIGFALLGDERTELVAFVLDLTALKHAEEKAARQLRKFVDSNIVGIVVANEAGILDANALYLQILGCSREDLLHGRVDWRACTPPEWIGRDLAAIEELRNQGHCTPFEKEYVRSDGSRVPILIGAAALTHEPELTWICYVVDLTSQKTLERELRLANNRLSQANEELRKFAYVAHDLKSPLRTISTMTTLLKRQFGQHLDDHGKNLMEYVISGASRMDVLISDILDYSRLDHQDALKTRPVDCAAFFAVAVMNLDSQIKDTGATVTADPLPTVQGGDQLLRVFQNLLDNALKYRGTDPPRVHFAAEPADSEWMISVRDNGLGFKMEDAERIFGAFQRLEGAGRHEGTGLGLAICRKIVEFYGGRMWAESQPNVGSTFYFTLPTLASASVRSKAGAGSND